MRGTRAHAYECRLENPRPMLQEIESQMGNFGVEFSRTLSTIVLNLKMPYIIRFRTYLLILPAALYVIQSHPTLASNHNSFHYFMNELKRIPNKTLTVNPEGGTQFCFVPEYSMANNFLAKYEVTLDRNIYVGENEFLFVFVSAGNEINYQKLPNSDVFVKLHGTSSGCFSSGFFNIEIYEIFYEILDHRIIGVKVVNK